MDEENFPNPFQLAQLDAAAQSQRREEEKAKKRTNPFNTGPAMIAAPEEGAVPDEESQKASLQEKMKELSKKEKALQEKEKLLVIREQALDGHERPPNNWPPFCPVMHFSVRGLPEEHHLLMRLQFAYLNLQVICFVWNILCQSFAFSAVCFLLAVVYAVVGTFVAYRLQYKILRKALSSAKISDARVVMFVIYMTVSVAFDGALGLGLMCGAGLSTALQADSPGSTIVYSSSFVAWLCAVGLGLVILRKTITLWKTGGGTVEKAKAQVASAAIAEAASNSAGSWGDRAAEKPARCAVQ